MIPARSVTSGGSNRREACGRITNTCRPTHPKPSAAAASCCSRGIDSTAPRVASAICALPQSDSPMVALVNGSNSSCEPITGETKKMMKIVTMSGRPRRHSLLHRGLARPPAHRHDLHHLLRLTGDREAAPDLDVEANGGAAGKEVDREQRSEHDPD